MASPTRAISPTLSLLGTPSNAGTILASNGTVAAAHQVLGTGTLDVGATSTLWLQAGAAASEPAHFLTATGMLELSSPVSFLGSIADFAGGDVIDWASTAADTASFINYTLTLSEGSTTVAHLRLGGSYTSGCFTLSSDGHGGTAIGFHG